MCVYCRYIATCNDHQVVITDIIRGTVYEANINCWLIDPDDGRCSPVDPWYHDFPGKSRDLIGCKGTLILVQTHSNDIFLIYGLRQQDHIERNCCAKMNRDLITNKPTASGPPISLEFILMDVCVIYSFDAVVVIDSTSCLFMVWSPLCAMSFAICNHNDQTCRSAHVNRGLSQYKDVVLPVQGFPC